jgi:hypothetical protein
MLAGALPHVLSAAVRREDVTAQAFERAYRRRRRSSSSAALRVIPVICG